MKILLRVHCCSHFALLFLDDSECEELKRRICDAKQKVKELEDAGETFDHDVDVAAYKAWSTSLIDAFRNLDALKSEEEQIFERIDIRQHDSANGMVPMLNLSCDI